MPHISSTSIIMTARLLAVALFIALGGAPAPASPAAEAKTLYAKTLSTLRNGATAGDIIASISPGTALDVLAEKDAAYQVEITGWSPEGAAKYLFSEMGQRIRLADLSAMGQAERVVMAQKKDYYDNVWKNVRLTGWIAKQDTSADISAIWNSASTLFHQRCTRCHALHRPDEFKANQWPSILKIMTVRAGLSPQGTALITQFVQTHAQDQNPPEDKSGETK